MSCRNSKLSSSLITIAKHASGLNDAQVLHINHELMNNGGRPIDTPSAREWNAFIDDVLLGLELGQIHTPPRSRNLVQRLESARTEEISGPRMFAARSIVRTAKATGEAHSEYLEHYALDMNMTKAEAKETFDNLYFQATAFSYHATNQDFLRRWNGVIEANNPLGVRHYLLLKGPRSLWAYQQMELARQLLGRDNPETVVNNNSRHVIHSSFISEIGYNYDTSSIEVVMNSNPELVYSYQATEEEYNDFSNYDVPGRWFTSHIRGRGFITHFVRDEAPRLPYRCDECGQFANLQHVCAISLPDDIEADVRDVIDRMNNAGGIAPLRPAPRFIFTQPISGRRPAGRSRIQLTINNINDIRAAAQVRTLYVPIENVRFAYDEHIQPHVLHHGVDILSGQITVESVNDPDYNGTPTYTVDGLNEEGNENNLTCSCSAFLTSNRQCEHVQELIRAIRFDINSPEDNYVRQSGGSRRTSHAENSTYVQQSMIRAELELAQEYEASIDATARITREWIPLSIKMEDNPEIFNELYAEYALKDKIYSNNKEEIIREYLTSEFHPVPYIKENAFGGLATREDGRGFGTEIEFSFPSHFTINERNSAINEIGAELFNAGLTANTTQAEYGFAHGEYNTTHDGNWSFEHDHTTGTAPIRGANRNSGEPVFGGEIVSPVMFDEAQTWENIEKVCSILKSAGAIPSNYAGAHVHVGVADYDHRVENHNRLLNSVIANEDLLYRLSCDPDRKVHRGLSYCSPNLNPSEPFQSINSMVLSNNSHRIALNLQGVNSRSWGINDRERDNVEFRTFDSSLEPSVIQAQISVAVHMAAGAMRKEESDATLEKISFGTNMEKIIQTGLGRFHIANWDNSTLGMRKFLDRFVSSNGEEDEKNNPRLRQLVALFASNHWQSRNGTINDNLYFSQANNRTQE